MSLCRGILVPSNVNGVTPLQLHITDILCSVKGSASHLAVLSLFPTPMSGANALTTCRSCSVDGSASETGRRRFVTHSRMVRLNTTQLMRISALTDEINSGTSEPSHFFSSQPHFQVSSPLPGESSLHFISYTSSRQNAGTGTLWIF